MPTRHLRWVLPSLAAACLFPDVSPFGAGDASVDAPSPSDAPSESLSDAGMDAPADVTRDAPIDAPFDSPSHFCVTQDATFCADFDESANPTAGFTSLYLADAGIVEVDDAASSSAPSSLLSGNVSLASGTSTHGCVVVNTGVTPAASATLDMDVRIDALASQGSYIEAFAIVFESATQSSLQLNLKSVSTEVGEELDALDGGKTYIGHVFPAPMTNGVWSHVTIAIVFGTTRTLTVTVNGVVQVSTGISASFVAGPVDVYAGNAYSPGPSDGARVHYDNVVLHAR